MGLWGGLWGRLGEDMAAAFTCAATIFLLRLLRQMAQASRLRSLQRRTIGRRGRLPHHSVSRAHANIYSVRFNCSIISLCTRSAVRLTSEPCEAKRTISTYPGPGGRSGDRRSTISLTRLTARSR